MSFRWRSWSGVATVLFLLYGAANLIAAIIVPTTLITGGAGALGGGGVVFSGDADSYLLGSSLGGLRTSNPKLDTLLVSSTVGMCGQMIALAALFLAITWFAFRRGQRWALWALLVGALIGWPHLIAIMAMYSQQRAPIASGASALVPFLVVLLFAFAAGAVGQRRAEPARVQRSA
jgi:hypothetical protein